MNNPLYTSYDAILFSAIAIGLLVLLSKTGYRWATWVLLFLMLMDCALFVAAVAFHGDAPLAILSGIVLIPMGIAIKINRNKLKKTG